jgi:hypothetical protein
MFDPATALFASIMALTGWGFVTAIGTFVIGCLVMIFMLEESMYGKGSITIIVWYAIIDWLLQWKMSLFIWNNPMKFGIYVVAFCCIGLVWSVIKLMFYMSKRRSKFQEYKDSWMKANKPNMSDIDAAWLEHYKTNYVQGMIPSFPKAKIMAWMAYWPFSILESFLSDVVRSLFNALYDTFGKIHRNIYAYYRKQFN